MRKFFSVALLFAVFAGPFCESRSPAQTPAPSSGGDAKTTVTIDPKSGEKSIVATPTDPAKTAAVEAKTGGKTVILWISVDGFRGDYADRGLTPFLSSLMEHGVYTKQLTPVFPSLTFPNHVSEATGVLPGVHGIVSNKFYDTAMTNSFNMPSDPNLLQSEPIWLTCARQGIPAAVLDWPLSQGEQALPASSPRAAKFNERYDSDLTDEARMQKCVDAFKESFDTPADGKPATGPFQLIMGYCHDVDSAGHKFGPDSEEVNKALKGEDAKVASIVNQMADIFKAKMHPEAGDKLYVLITTDHGMAPVTQLVNLRKLIGEDVPESVIGLTSGSYALVYLSALPGSQREEMKNKIVANLKESPFAKFWTSDQLPANLQPANPTRTGDIVISLDPGYDFTGKPDAPKVAAIETDPRSSKGMHAYDPALEKRMLGFTVLSRIGSDKRGVDLGQIDNLRIHPTIAKLLGIQPAPNAKAAPLDPLP